MAKHDMIANHKRGLVNSTLGNGFRGGLTGAAVFGGIAAIATIATGGLALPLVLGAAAAGGALFGAANAVGGALRWGAEFVGGVIGINRKQRSNSMGPDGQDSPQQAQGMGMVEGIVALVGAAMGMQSMKNKIVNAFGGNEKAPEHAPQQEFTPRGSETAAFSRPGFPPEMPGLLQDKMVRNEKGGVELHLSRDDMANPDMREAVKNFGRAQAAYRDQLANGSIDDKRAAVDMQRTARFVDENGVRDPSKMPGFNKETGTYIVRPEHLMNEDVQHQMNSEGKAHQKDMARTIRQEERQVNNELRDLTSRPLISRTENPFQAPVQDPATAAYKEKFASTVSDMAKEADARNAADAVSSLSGKMAAPEAVAPAQRADTPATQAFGANMGKLAQESTAARAATPTPQTQSVTPSGLHIASGNGDIQKALSEARQTAQASGVQHKGAVGADTAVRSGSNTSQQRPTGPAIGQ